MNASSHDLIIPCASLGLGVTLAGLYIYMRSHQIIILRLAIWILLTVSIFGCLGLIAAKIESAPLAFAVVTIFSILLGYLYMLLAPVTMQWWTRNATLDVFLTGFILQCFGVSAFSLVYALLYESGISSVYFLISLYGFLAPALFIRSYDYWMKIPPKKYKTWVYPLHLVVPSLQPIEPMRLMMNFTPTPSGKNGPFDGYEVEFPTNVSLGELFHYFIFFHNKHREHRRNPIQFVENKVPVGWVLFKYSDRNKRVYLNMDKTLIENEIVPNQSIYALSLATN